MLVACMFTWWQRWDETPEGDNEAVTADDDEELLEQLQNDLDEIFEVVHGVVAIAEELANKSIANFYPDHVTNQEVS